MKTVLPVSSDSVASIVHEVAHKELVQTPMFVADCFHKVLGNILIEGEMSCTRAFNRPQRWCNILVGELSSL